MQLVGALAVALLLSLTGQRSGAAEPAPAPDAQPVVVQLEQFRIVTDQDGKEQRVDAATVKPGDIIEYRVTYHNTGKAPVAGLAAELPIPDGTEYLPRSAAHPTVAAEARTEKERYAREPLVRTITDPDGTVRKLQVPYAEYRSLRWLLGEMPVGGKTAVSARVRVAPVGGEPDRRSAAASAPPAPVAPARP